jgi:hypothetical protein
VIVMADSAALRNRRARRHRQGDHSLCMPGRCPEAGTVATADMRELRAALEREFAADPGRLAAVRRLVQLAAGQGQPAVSALRELDRMLEASRRAKYVPLGPGGGPVTIDDEVCRLAEVLIDLEYERAFRRLSARAGQVGWEAAVEEWRREHRAREASRRAADARAQRFGVRREVS